MSVMNPYLPNENLHNPLLDRFLEQGIRGGQYSDGSQKDGILKYEKGRPVAIYDPNAKAYIAISDFQAGVEQKLGKMPVAPAWKAVVGNKAKDEILLGYFGQVKAETSLGAELTKTYANRSCAIGLQLVSSGVAHNDNDVNTVLLTGFFHAYGPINKYLE